MEKHLTYVVVLNLVYRSLAIFGALVLTIVAIFFDRFITMITHLDASSLHEVPPFVLDIVPMVLSIVALVVFVVSVAGILGAVGVHRRKEWGRILLLVISFFSLIRIPLGTLLGGYSIWVLLNDETIRLFNPAAAPAQKPA